MVRLAILINHIGTDQPCRAVHRGGQRNDHLPHAQLRRIAAGMHRRRAAESKQHEISRIMAFFYGRLANQIAHVRVGDAVNAARGLHLGHLQAAWRSSRGSPPASWLVQLHSAAEKIIFIEIAENQIGVGNRRLFAADIVADRTRRCAGALGSDFEQSGFRIDPGDTAAAGADRFDPDLGRQNIVTQNNRLVVALDDAVAHNADFESRPAHVGGENVFFADMLAQKSRADDARRGTRLNDADGIFAGRLDRPARRRRPA